MGLQLLRTLMEAAHDKRNTSQLDIHAKFKHHCVHVAVVSLPLLSDSLSPSLPSHSSLPPPPSLTHSLPLPHHPFPSLLLTLPHILPPSTPTYWLLVCLLCLSSGSCLRADITMHLQGGVGREGGEGGWEGGEVNEGESEEGESHTPA